MQFRAQFTEIRMWILKKFFIDKKLSSFVARFIRDFCRERVEFFIELNRIQ